MGIVGDNDLVPSPLQARKRLPAPAGNWKPPQVYRRNYQPPDGQSISLHSSAPRDRAGPPGESNPFPRKRDDGRRELVAPPQDKEESQMPTESPLNKRQLFLRILRRLGKPSDARKIWEQDPKAFGGRDQTVVCNIGSKLAIKQLVVREPGPARSGGRPNYLYSLPEWKTAPDAGRGAAPNLSAASSAASIPGESDPFAAAVGNLVIAKTLQGEEHAIGEVIGVHRDPTFLIVKADGSHITWSAALCRTLPEHRLVEYWRERAKAAERALEQRI